MKSRPIQVEFEPQGSLACLMYYLESTYGFLVAQMVKNIAVTQETWVPSVGREDPLEEEMATHSSILAWRIPWTEESGGLWSTESQSQIQQSN